MHLRIATTRNGLLALAVIAALFSFAPAALADHGNGRGNGRGHNKEYSRGYSRGGGYTTQRWRTPQRVYAQRPTYYRQSPRISANVRIYSGGGSGYYGGGYYSRPTYVACAPRYVTYRPQRVVIVRPAPYVRIGGVFGSVGISAVFGPRRHYSSYDYGCNFCDAHFSSYGAYESHVQSCAYRPADVRIQCQNWDDAGYRDYCSGDDDRGYDSGNYRSNDGYDDNGYRGNDGYDDRGYDYDDGN